MIRLSASGGRPLPLSAWIEAEARAMAAVGFEIIAEGGAGCRSTGSTDARGAAPLLLCEVACYEARVPRRVRGPETYSELLKSKGGE